MTSENVEITGMNRVAVPRPNAGGSIILAHFDCHVHGITLLGCAFVRTSRGGLTVWPPKIEAPEIGRRAVAFTSERLKSELVRLAQLTYELLGGKDGGWLRTGETVEEAADRAERSKPDPLKERNRLAAQRRVTERASAIVRGDDDTDDASGLRRFLGEEAC